MFHSLDRRFLYTAHKIEAQFLDFDQIKSGSGTCFFVDGEDGRIFLVTNRHVLDPAYEKPDRRHWKRFKLRISGFMPPDFVNFECTLLVDEVRFPTSFDEDVGVARVVTTIEGNWEGNRNLNIQNIPKAILATQDDFDDLFLGDTLYFPGYPDWHDQKEGRPIMRRGTLSSDPRFDYLGPGMRVGGRILAYEAFSFGGSSGSPVFLAPFGVTLNGEGGNFRPSKLLGVNAGHLLTRDGNKHHSGISYFFRSKVVQELIGPANPA